MALELRFTIPGQVERRVRLDQEHMKIGALLSNQVVLRAPGIDPIHALIEEGEDGSRFITDLGSATGVKLNGQHIDVEALIKGGDTIAIGGLSLKVVETEEKIAPPQVVPGIATVPAVPATAPVRAAATVRSSADDVVQRRDDTVSAVAASSDTRAGNGDQPERKKDMLFSPRKARPGGDVLEAVAYWGDTVLEVELFHPTYKGFDKVTIGDPTKAHLIAAGPSSFDVHQLARFSGSGFKLTLKDGMRTRLRKGGKVEKIDQAGEVALGNRDIAHIRYGAVSYFLMFVKPPPLDFPRTGPRDPLFMALMSIAMLFYLILVPVAWTHQYGPEKKDKDDIWQVVQVPEKDKPVEKEKEKPKEKPKPEIKIAEKKTPPKKPPPPKPKEEVKPAKPIEKEKPVQPKPVEKPVEQKKPTEALKPTPKAERPDKAEKAEAKPAEKPVAKPEPNKAAGATGPKTPTPSLSKLAGVGMPSTGASKPDFKLAGPTLPNTALGKSGGVVGSGMNQAGAPIKGVGKADYKGVEGVANNKPAGVNLSKLGLGVGKIMSKTGPGAINTNFKDSAGGAGGGMGSASKTYGLGGVGSGKSLGLAGASGAANNFGSGSGGLLGGQGGSGGGGGNGIGPGFGGGGGGAGGAGGKGKGGSGHGRANVEVPAGDPVVSGGLTAQEIMAVIRANLNQIRHCYEQLLQRSPSASGKMGTTFTIDTGGRVTAVNVSQDTINDSMMRGCVTGKIQRWPFPKPRGGQPVTVNYPFVFNPL